MTSEDLRGWAEAAGLVNVQVDPRAGVCSVRGDLTARSGVFPVRLALPRDFPSVAPIVWLLEPPPDRRGHVMKDGTLCWTRRDVLIDLRRPEAVIADCLEACRRLLSLSADASAAGLLDEIESFWAELPGIVPAHAELERIVEPCRLYRVGVGGEVVGWTTRALSPSAVWPVGATTEPGGLVVPLVEGNVALPAIGEPLDVNWVRRMVHGRVHPNHRSALDRLMRRPSLGGDLVVLVLPRARGEPATLGVSLRGRGERHPLDGGRVDVVPVAIFRRDRAAFRPQGAAAERLDRARVAIVGVGSVGGHAAVELARAGVGSLTLIDDDFLAPRNVYRHVLGASALGEKKASALAARIVGELPYTRATALSVNVEDAIRSKLLDLAAHDAVVIAVDKPSVALWLHQQLRSAGVRIGAMAWLEPMGVAAHSLRFGCDGAGCLECMYTDAVTGDFRECAFHLAAPGQDFPRTLAGCASPTVTVGSVDAVRAAILLVRQLVEALGHDETRTELVTWKGDLAAFRAAGFHLSGRADAEGEIVRYSAVQIARAACRLCGG